MKVDELNQEAIDFLDYKIIAERLTPFNNKSLIYAPRVALFYLMHFQFQSYLNTIVFQDNRPYQKGIFSYILGLIVNNFPKTGKKQVKLSSDIGEILHSRSLDLLLVNIDI